MTEHLIDAGCCNAAGDPHEIRIDGYGAAMSSAARAVCVAGYSLL
jgi:hypothetical protein